MKHRWPKFVPVITYLKYSYHDTTLLPVTVFLCTVTGHIIRNTYVVHRVGPIVVTDHQLSVMFTLIIKIRKKKHDVNDLTLTWYLYSVPNKVLSFIIVLCCIYWVVSYFTESYFTLILLLAWCLFIRYLILNCLYFHCNFLILHYFLSGVFYHFQ